MIAARLSMQPRPLASQTRVSTSEPLDVFLCPVIFHSSHHQSSLADPFRLLVAADSIDYNDPRSTVSWAIDVLLDDEIEVPSVASLYNKYLPKLRDVVADRKFKMNNGDTSEPTLDWVFLRKYTGKLM